MHSDQTRKDGSSESMIQALYYDFVANYVKTRMYSTRYVQCNSGGQRFNPLYPIRMHLGI